MSSWFGDESFFSMNDFKLQTWTVNDKELQGEMLKNFKKQGNFSRSSPFC